MFWTFMKGFSEWNINAHSITGFKRIKILLKDIGPIKTDIILYSVYKKWFVKTSATYEIDQRLFCFWTVYTRRAVSSFTRPLICHRTRVASFIEVPSRPAAATFLRGVVIFRKLRWMNHSNGKYRPPQKTSFLYSKIN